MIIRREKGKLPEAFCAPIWRLRVLLADLPGPIYSRTEIVEALREVAAIERSPWRPDPSGGPDAELKGPLGGLSGMLWAFCYLDEDADALAEDAAAARITREALACIDQSFNAGGLA